MRVTVRAFNELKDLTAALPPGGALELSAGATVAEVLQRLEVPEDRRSHLVLFRNGRPARLNTPLEDGDTLVILPPMTGG